MPKLSRQTMFERLPENASTVLARLNEAGFEAFLVGGCVRDELMNKPLHDYDITTNALPAQTKSVFCDFRVVETGMKHGTVTVVCGGENFEVTTFRTDGEYTDNRHPASVSFAENIESDLSRRDFTVNAMAYSPVKGLIDLFGGQADIEHKIIRCVGNPDKRFHEDGLRILRALRFSSVLDFEIEENTALSIHKNKELLKNISRERIFSELKKLLCGSGVFRVLMPYHDVISEAIPELAVMYGFRQHNIHHAYDVWEHTARAVEHCAADECTRLAALLHDCGKPAAFTLDENGAGHFYSHEEKSAEIAEKVLRSLKTDNKTHDTVVFLVRKHMLPFGEVSEKTVKRLIGEAGAENMRRLLDLRKADVFALGTGEQPDGFERMERLIDDASKPEVCTGLKTLHVNGGDIMSLGIPAGRAVGELLSRLLEGVLDGEVENERAALLEYAQECIRRGQ